MLTNKQKHPVPEALASLPGSSKEAAEKAVQFAMTHMDISRPAAIGHLVDLAINAKGQFQADIDGGLGTVFPWLYEAHLAAHAKRVAETPKKTEEKKTPVKRTTRRRTKKTE